MDLQEKRAHKESWDGLEPRVRMDPTELPDHPELQENKVFLEYLVARERLEILERRVHQGLLASLEKPVFQVPKVGMVGQEPKDHREIRVTQDQTGHRDLLVLMENMAKGAPLDQKVKKSQLKNLYLRRLLRLVLVKWLLL